MQNKNVPAAPTLSGLRAKATSLEQEVRRLRAGEDSSPLKEGEVMSPGQWLYAIQGMPENERMQAIQRTFESMYKGTMCTLQHHDLLDLENVELRRMVYRMRRAFRSVIGDARADAVFDLLEHGWNGETAETKDGEEWKGVLDVSAKAQRTD